MVLVLFTLASVFAVMVDTARSSVYTNSLVINRKRGHYFPWVNFLQSCTTYFLFRRYLHNFLRQIYLQLFDPLYVLSPGSGVGTELKPGWRREAAAHQLIRAGPVFGPVCTLITVFIISGFFRIIRIIRT